MQPCKDLSKAAKCGELPHLQSVERHSLIAREWLDEHNSRGERNEQLNAVEIEEAISQLADQPFDPESFPYAFLEAFGNKETTIKRLRTGASNKSDVGGVLQTNNIHIAVCGAGRVTKTLASLKASPATAKAKAKFILATDGEYFEAENLASGEP